jgi:hypothetical protein
MASKKSKKTRRTVVQITLSPNEKLALDAYAKAHTDNNRSAAVGNLARYWNARGPEWPIIDPNLFGKPLEAAVSAMRGEGRPAPPEVFRAARNMLIDYVFLGRKHLAELAAWVKKWEAEYPHLGELKKLDAEIEAESREFMDRVRARQNQTTDEAQKPQ